jgi:hypothetical protein
MRTIKTKFAGECRKCGADLAVGVEVVYERRMGIFCPACAPTDPEEIRSYRQEAADRKADRLDGWAEKREERASATLNSNPEVRRDWAFITQPGRIPLRERMNRADDRACESLGKAREMRGRADRIRKVRVAGDAERAREAHREEVRAWIAKGQRVFCHHWGEGTVQRVNRKTGTVLWDRIAKAYPEPLEWLQRV